MRSIALAIFLGLGGIEMLYAKVNGMPYSDTAYVFGAFLLVIFLACLAGGW